MSRSVSARIAALKAMSASELKGMWRDLFDTEPPAYNRRSLESRLAYRIQEIEYGGLKKETRWKLAALAEQLEDKAGSGRRRKNHDRPIAGTQLIREYKGIEYCVTVLNNGYEYQGRRYKSLSAVARAITGSYWNGWRFFGLRNHRIPVRRNREAGR